MFVEREEAIRTRAHALWLREGRPDGRALEHWLAAQREQIADDGAQSWFEAIRHGDELAWLRRALWAPQPYAFAG